MFPRETAWKANTTTKTLLQGMGEDLADDNDIDGDGEDDDDADDHDDDDDDPATAMIKQSFW